MLRSTLVLCAGCLSGLALQASAAPQLGPGTVQRRQKISDTVGGAVPPLRNLDQLGRAVANLGDLDGDDVVDLAAAGHGDDDGGTDQGAVHILFLSREGRVRGAQKISERAGGFTGILDRGDQLGRSLANLGDLDGDGVIDLAAGANFDDDGGFNRGAVWLLFLDRDGTVKRTAKISSLAGNFPGPLKNGDEFGRAVASTGDLDGDGIPELAVGAALDDTAGSQRGAVWILFLERDGTVRRQLKIASGQGGFRGRLRSFDYFGFSLANLGDLDGDGVNDLAVGAALDDDGAVNAGAVWILFLNRDGTVKNQQKISRLAGGFTGLLESPDQFGVSVAALGELNADGVTELAVGAVKDSDGGPERGAVYVLFLNRNGTVAFHQKISDSEGNFGLPLDDEDWLGSSLAPLGDLDRDGVFDLVAGARFDDDGGTGRGALYVLFLNGSSQSLVASSPEGSGRVPEPERASVVSVAGRAASVSLTLHSGVPVPGATLVFELGAADVLPPGASVRLLVARDRSPESWRASRLLGELRLDPGQLLPGLCGSFFPGRTDQPATLSLALPDDPALAGSQWFVQGVWLQSESLAFTDALELRVR